MVECERCEARSSFVVGLALQLTTWWGRGVSGWTVRRLSTGFMPAVAWRCPACSVTRAWAVKREPRPH